MRGAPAWTGVAIGLLFGMVLVMTWLLATRVAETGRPQQSAGRDTVIVREVQVPVGASDVVGMTRRNAVVRATERVAPAVVSINAIDHQTVSRAVVPRGMEMFERFYPGMFPRREFRNDVSSLGSGVIVSSDGYVISNMHVVSNADRLIVTLNDGHQYDAEVLATAPNWDLSLLQIKDIEGELPVAPIASSDHDLYIGEWAIAIGSPFGYLLADTQPTVTVGVISAVNRDIKQTSGDQTFLGMIQTDASINPGNSGGPLINSEGEVIGINTFIFTESGGSIGLGFAVPIERASWIIRDVREYGYFRRPYWGVVMQLLSPTMVRYFELDNEVGFIVREVDEGSPAWKGGLRIYDVIREINGVPLVDKGTVDRLIYEAKVGTELSFKAERDGETFEGRIVLEELPQQ
jgi:serine protease Do